MYNYTAMAPPAMKGARRQRSLGASLGFNVHVATQEKSIPIGSMYGIYANIGGILMVNVIIYSIHGSYGIENVAKINTNP